MNVVQYVECPYCGTSKPVRMHIESTDYTVREVVTCDCDRFYVVGFCLIVEVTTLKIEGEQAKYDAFEEACVAEAAQEGDTAGMARYEADTYNYAASDFAYDAHRELRIFGK